MTDQRKELRRNAMNIIITCRGSSLSRNIIIIIIIPRLLWDEITIRENNQQANVAFSFNCLVKLEILWTTLKTTSNSVEGNAIVSPSVLAPKVLNIFKTGYLWMFITFSAANLNSIHVYFKLYQYWNYMPILTLKKTKLVFGIYINWQRTDIKS